MTICSRSLLLHASALALSDLQVQHSVKSWKSKELYHEFI